MKHLWRLSMRRALGGGPLYRCSRCDRYSVCQERSRCTPALASSLQIFWERHRTW